jgi:hypothetical protein
MIKRFVGSGGERLRVREGCVWGEYCVGEGKGKEKGGEERSEADGGWCCCIAGMDSVKRVYFS